MSKSPSPTVAAAACAYRMLWRWHFYAGLFVMPFLIVLAITGTIYCFQPQIEPLLYPHLLKVRPAGESMSAQALLDRARAAAPAGAVATTYTIDPRPDASTEFIFRLPTGMSESVYLNPHSGEVLGRLSVEDRFMKQVRMLHRALLAGKPGELLMELAGCWTLVMIATGVAMWWPRLRAAGIGAFRMANATSKRGWWKEIHLLLGAWLALGALAFVLSGLPWTASWGKQFKAITTAANLGRPDTGTAAHQHGNPVAQQRQQAPHDAPAARGSHSHTVESLPLTDVPWATGFTTVPTGSSGHTPVGLDRVLEIAKARGASAGCQIALPASASAVYTVSCFPSDPQGERTLHIDQHSGDVVKDIRFADYGAVAKAVSYGTSLHMGRYFGLANQIACATISIGLMALAVTGCVMWLRRKPARTLGAPSHPSALPAMRVWVIGLGLLGVIFPMMGVTLAGVWLIDRMIARGKGTPPAASERVAA
ncbi:PepSY-associated TM helix domain-containing protein [Cupriavidus basilensis]|uniref:PepSY-associated TM helix domain-containing protein n=1 Tax=Cupriavidus basilensis TaxID=68895 RepID=UPI000750CE0A|nr:PepSY domain-containing protein [Cupriavidus basilensis]